MRVHALRLLPGADVKRSIEGYVRSHDIRAGWVLTCVGSLSEAVLRMPGAREFLTLRRDFEVVSVEGTLSPDGCHLHASVSDRTGTVFGGHLSAGCIVRTTCELVLGEALTLEFSREHDERTGFDELVVDERGRALPPESTA
jgi:predicted DNA-binding protein with PD1-like motif